MEPSLPVSTIPMIASISSLLRQVCLLIPKSSCRSISPLLFQSISQETALMDFSKVFGFSCFKMVVNLLWQTATLGLGVTFRRMDLQIRRATSLCILLADMQSLMRVSWATFSPLPTFFFSNTSLMRSVSLSMTPLLRTQFVRVHTINLLQQYYVSPIGTSGSYFLLVFTSTNQLCLRQSSRDSLFAGLSTSIRSHKFIAYAETLSLKGASLPVLILAVKSQRLNPVKGSLPLRSMQRITPHDHTSERSSTLLVKHSGALNNTAKSSWLERASSALIMSVSTSPSPSSPDWKRMLPGWMLLCRICLRCMILTALRSRQIRWDACNSLYFLIDLATVRRLPLINLGITMASVSAQSKNQNQDGKNSPCSCLSVLKYFLKDICSELLATLLLSTFITKASSVPCFTPSTVVVDFPAPSTLLSGNSYFLVNGKE